MAKRSASVSKGGDDPDAKTPRSASGGRKRAPKVVYAEPSEIRDGTAPESVDLAMSMLPVRTEEHKASVFKVMCWNIASLRSIEKGDAAILRRMVEREQPDVLVLNEHKLSADLLDLEDPAPAAASASRQRSMAAFLVDKSKAAPGPARGPDPEPAAVAVPAESAGARPSQDDAATALPAQRAKSPQIGKLGRVQAAAAKSSASATSKPKKGTQRFSAREIFGPGVFAHETWACSTAKKGYAGVALFSKTVPLKAQAGIGHPELDAEGRAVVAEWEGLAVVGVYVPNSGQTLARLGYRTELWDPQFRALLQRLERERGRVLVVGDMNVALRDFDVYDAKRMRNKTAGFCDAERSNFASLIAPRGVVFGPPPARATAASDGSAAAATFGSATARPVGTEGTALLSPRGNEEAASEPGIFGSVESGAVAGALTETAPTVTVVSPPAAAAVSAPAASTRDSLAPPPASSPASLATEIAQSVPGLGFVDTWAQRPENLSVAEWSFFSMRFGMRPKNKGWRIDYALASERLWPSVTASYIRSKAIGSDHLPIGVEMSRDVLHK